MDTDWHWRNRLNEEVVYNLPERRRFTGKHVLSPTVLPWLTKEWRNHEDMSSQDVL